MENEQGKLFIGGISWETNEQTLKQYFQKYGEVSEIVIMRDKVTGRPRGFGFVGFAEPSIIEKVLQDKHNIDGRQVELKRALPREEQHKSSQKSGENPGAGVPRTKKIFVGGLAPSVTDEDFRKHFEQFGNITDVVVMYDHVSNRPRGFGFITFDTEEAVDKVVTKNFHELHGKMVEVKRALPKEMFPAGARSRSSPVPQGYAVPQNNRYGTQIPSAARTGGLGAAPYAGTAHVPGYFGGYVAGVNGGAYGAAPVAPAAPAYSGAGVYAPGYGNPSPYGAGAAAPNPYGSASMPANYASATAAAGHGGPWGAAVPAGQTAAVSGGYGYAGSGDVGGFAYSSPTAPYMAPGASGAVPAGYQAASGEVYGASGYGESFNASAASGYGAAGRQPQRVSDSRFRPYPASSDRSN
eukprot:TRINITY_DN3783_c0_g1_i1.p1 TRINITY_DN3783_c0_g1~~TRINITY_DN3783_c0_g1_i1.p1  ORF type:complete len:410 (-),score=93.27 TRINITY_DN3783_c0_g1_i1:463-1692(-)